MTVNGSGFSDAAKVEFGDGRIATFVRVSDSRITAVVPDNGLTGSIRVTAASGPAGSSAGTFYVAPRLDDFNPKRGSPSTTITINGANFIPGSGTTAVYFGTLPSPQVSVTANSQVQAKVPVGVTNSILYVGTFVGWATSRVEFVSTTLPVIDDFTPTNGLPGRSISVVINGANLTPVTSVKFNGVSSPFTRTADTQIQTTIPAGATSGRITVSGANGTGTSGVDFIVGPTIANDPPAFPPFNPMAGKPGDFIYVYGNDFTGVTNVSFGGVLAGGGNVSLPASNQVYVKVPVGAKTGRVKVLTTNGEAISPVDFTIGPLIDHLSRTNGPVGADVTVYGAGFEIGATQVKFGSVSATPYSFPANNQFIVKVPTGATNAPISVFTTLGTNTTPYKFLVTTSVPLIDEFDPVRGPAGTQMKIRGAKFTGATSVTIGGVPVINPQVTADTLILATVPSGVLTGPVRVSNASGTGTSVQTYYAPPWVTSFSPTSARVGEFVSVTGTNFTSAQGLYFSSEPALINSATANNVLVQVPLAARSGPLTMITPGGTFVTANTFTVLPRITDFQPRLGPVGSLVTITGTSFYDVTNVAFNGKAATFTVVSPQEITATVPTGATTGLIRVGNHDGEAFSAIAFTVTQASDLRVSEVVSTNFVAPGNSVTYTATVTNAGPSILTGVTLTNRFSSGLSLQTAVASQGSCGISGNVVACTLGVITNSRSATVTIVASFPTDGVFTNTVSVRAIESDTLAGNNSAQNTVVVASIAQRTLGIELLSAPRRVVIKWPVSQVPFKLQSVGVLDDTNLPWTSISSTFFTVNGTNRFTNTSPTADKLFYRLRYP